MVVSKFKFFCGEGVILLHYCKVCGTPHISIEKADECERGHKAPATRLKRERTPNPE